MRKTAPVDIGDWLQRTASAATERSTLLPTAKLSNRIAPDVERSPVRGIQVISRAAALRSLQHVLKLRLFLQFQNCIHAATESLQDNIQKILFQRATYAKLFCHLSVYDIGKTHGRLSTSFPFSKQSMLKILQQLRCMLSN